MQPTTFAHTFDEIRTTIMTTAINGNLGLAEQLYAEAHAAVAIFSDRVAAIHRPKDMQPTLDEQISAFLTEYPQDITPAVRAMLDDEAHGLANHWQASVARLTRWQQEDAQHAPVS